MNNQSFDVSLNIASSGFCISEERNIYIANHQIIGFIGGWSNGNNFVKLLIPGRDVIIYEHINEQYDFNKVCKKIIMKILDRIRYESNTNIHIDKIIKEVLKDGENRKETFNIN